MNVLVTGGNSGIGRCIAEHLLAKGFNVLGTSRNPSNSNQNRFELIELDITSKESIEKALCQLDERGFTVDVLVNNAGVAVNGSFEETAESLARKQLETNFWGSVALTKMVLPQMRRQRRGKIIFITSLAGLVGVPYQSYYSASKHAVEGIAKSLRHEVKEFGIDVSCVEPGFVKSNLHNSFLVAAESIEDYNASRSNALKAINDSIKTAPEPAVVAETVSRIIDAKSPKMSYKVGRGVKVLVTLQSLASSIFEWGARRKFRLT